MNEQEKRDHELEHEEIFDRKCDQQFAIERAVFERLEYNLRRARAILKLCNKKYQEFETEKEAGPVDEREKVEFELRTKIIDNNLFELEYLLKDHTK